MILLGKSLPSSRYSRVPKRRGPFRGTAGVRSGLPQHERRSSTQAGIGAKSTTTVGVTFRSAMRICRPVYGVSNVRIAAVSAGRGGAGVGPPVVQDQSSMAGPQNP